MYISLNLKPWKRMNDSNDNSRFIQLVIYAIKNTVGTD